MRISVLIPAYNAGDFLEETLRGVASGLGSEDEIIVVDDHSQDGTIELAQAVLSGVSCQFKVVLNEGKGACRARNHALTLASGKWVQWLDADDLIPAGKWGHVLPLAEMARWSGALGDPFGKVSRMAYSTTAAIGPSTQSMEPPNGSPRTA